MEVDDKTLLQKAPHILAAGYKEIKLEALPPYWLTFLATKDAMQASGV